MFFAALLRLWATMPETILYGGDKKPIQPAEANHQQLLDRRICIV